MRVFCPVFALFALLLPPVLYINETTMPSKGTYSAVSYGVLHNKRDNADADSRVYFGGLPREELARRAQAAKLRNKTLQDTAKMIGSEVLTTEYYDETTGQCHTVTRDELILRNFATRLLKRPTPQGLLAWQKLKGEDVVRIAPADRLEDKTTDELKNELQGFLSALNNLPASKRTTTAAAPTEGNGQQPDRTAPTGAAASPDVSKNTAIDMETGEHIEVAEVERPSQRRALPWLLR